MSDGTELIVAPIVFQLPAYKPDTRLRAFHQEYQVHSVILKLYSAFFRRLLDSPEKTPSVQDGYRYNWATAVDGNDWHLVSTDNYASIDPTRWDQVGKETTTTLPYTTLSGSLMPGFTQAPKETLATHIDSFTMMLSAMYNSPYIIQDPNNLNLLIRFADYYCCLPIVSRTLDGAMLANDKQQWYEELKDFGPGSLKNFAKLRNAALFRDTLVFFVGKWRREPNYADFKDDPKLWGVVRHARDRISNQIINTFQAILEQTAHEEGPHPLVRERVKDLHAIEAKTAETFLDDEYEFDSDADDEYADPVPVRFACLPKCFRELRDPAKRKRGRLERRLDKLLWCNLRFPVQQIQAGKGSYDGFFLCATVDNEELPWDLTETDW